MKSTNIFVCLAVGLVVLIAACLYSEWAAQRAVARNQQQELEFWRGKLLPLYEDTGISYNKDPKTKEELFEPLFRISQTVR